MKSSPSKFRIAVSVISLLCVIAIIALSAPPGRKYIIASDDAASIAITDSGTDATLKDCEITRENQLGEVYYKITFEAGGTVYVYYIHAETGSILSKNN